MRRINSKQQHCAEIRRKPRSRRECEERNKIAEDGRVADRCGSGAVRRVQCLTPPQFALAARWRPPRQHLRFECT